MSKNFKKFILLLIFLLFLPNFASALTPNDPYFKYQWYLKTISAETAWENTTGASDIIVAVLDSGVDLNHPDLQNNIWINQDEISGDGLDNDHNGYIDDIKGWNFLENNNDPTPLITGLYTTEGANHGTVIAGLVAGVGDNYQGITGLNWSTKIMPLRILNSVGEGDTITVGRAIEYAINNGADVINLSFVGQGDKRAMADIIEKAYQNNVVIVSAAGNTKNNSGGVDLDQTPMYPVCNDGPAGSNYVLGVAATDEQDKKAIFTNYGSNCIDVSAPGTNFFSTRLEMADNEEFKYSYSDGWEGSSMAAPLVSGLAALLKSIKHDYTNQEIYDLIINNSDPVDELNLFYKGKLGKGRINAGKTIAAALGIQLVVNSAPLTTPADQTIFFGPIIPVAPANILDKIMIVPWSRAEPEVKIYSAQGEKKASFLAYNSAFTGGVNLTSGDVDGDGQNEVITAAGPSGGPHVRIFNHNGQLKSQFFAYENNFRGGLAIASGDLNNDNKDEIVVAPLKDKSPLIRVFNMNGDLLTEFMAYNQSFHGGVSLAVGKVLGGQQNYIVTAAGPGGGPHVRIFGLNGDLIGEFFAYEASFRGGVSLAVGDVYNDGKIKIITAPFSASKPLIRVFDYNGRFHDEFYAYAETFRGGVSLAVGDVDGDNNNEIITGAGPSGGPHIRVFNSNGQVKNQFFAYESSFRGGINVNILNSK